MVYNLAKEKFDGVQYPSERPQAEGNPSICNSNPPPLEAMPKAPTFQVREDTPCLNTIPASTNLFEARGDWSVPPTQAPSVKVENTEVPPQSSDPPCYSNAQTCWRKMFMGTALPHLQEEEEDSAED